jgi:hypothetical protein
MADNGTWIASLKTADEVAAKTKGHVSAERLLELARGDFIPHYEIEGKVLFSLTEALNWLRDNAVIRKEGRQLLRPFIELTPLLMIDGQERKEVPFVIKGLAPWLSPMPIQSCMHANFPGIYFLCRDGEVVYVGQSKQVAKRIGCHLYDKEFDFAFCMRIPESDLDFVEGEIVRHLKPKFNFSKRGLEAPYPKDADSASVFAREVVGTATTAMVVS